MCKKMADILKHRWNGKIDWREGIFLRLRKTPLLI